jgi:HSP20 family protein
MVNLARRDPMSLADEFFKDFFRRTGYPLAVTRAAALPGVTRARMDVVDKGDRYEVVVDLPGVKKEDIHVTVEGARVAIAADARRDNEVKNGEALAAQNALCLLYTSPSPRDRG